MLLLALLLITCVCVFLWGVGSWWYSKQTVYLLKAAIYIASLLALPVTLFLMVYADSQDIDFSVVLSSVISNDGKLKMVELTQISEKNNHYHTKVLIRNPPESTDSVKKLMVRFFDEKQRFLDSVYTGRHLFYVDFYKYTIKTAYFTKHPDDYAGFSPNALERRTEAYIGYIETRVSCKRGYNQGLWATNDSTKYYDKMHIYDDDEILYSECDNKYIDNWKKYR